MKAVYANDTEKGPGYGIIRISQPRFPLPVEGCHFSVRRASDNQCLIPGGWQDAESPLKPAGTAMEGDTLLLCIGPDVVDQLDELEIYRLTVIAPDGTRDAGSLGLRGIIYSPMHGGGLLSEVQAKQAAPKPEPATKPEPEIPVTQTKTVEPPVAPLITPPVTEPLPSPGHPNRLVPVAILVILLLLGAAAWWYWQHSRQPDASPQAAQTDAPQAEAAPPKPKEDKPGPQQPAKPEEEPQQAAAKAAPPATPAPQLSPLEQARACLRAKCPPDKALELSRSMSESADGRDAAFLLLGASAEGGQPDAMTQLARFYDPTDKAPVGSIRKDAEQARLWYAKAKAAGQAEAGSRLEVLDAWLRQEADKGDARAREILGPNK